MAVDLTAQTRDRRHDCGDRHPFEVSNILRRHTLAKTLDATAATLAHTDLRGRLKNVSMTRPPDGFGDLLAGLNQRNGEANGAGQGQIDVRIVTQPDGSRSFIVDILWTWPAASSTSPMWSRPARPVGRIDVPDGVQVLSLENQHDIVPHLDGADNPDRPNCVTVSFDTQYGSVGDNHGIEQSYLPAAQSLDSSTDPSVAAFRTSADPFFSGDGTTVRSHVYQITRS